MAIARHTARHTGPLSARAGQAARPGRLLSAVSPALSIVLVVVAWDLLVRLGHYQQFILPGPGVVFSRMRDLIADGTLPTNAAVTMEEALFGFLIAALIALPLGYVLAHAPAVERFLAPLIAASQAVPAVAVAPLLVLWLDTGILPKVAVSAVIVVFPLLVNTITGIRGVPREYIEVARVFGAPLWEQIARVELPLAAPVLLGGVKLGLTLSLTGAVVGEFVASDQGLGFLLNVYRDNLDAPSLFAALLVLAALGVTLYSFISLLERIVAKWQG